MNVRQVIPRDAIPSVDDPEFGPEYDGGLDDDVLAVDVLADETGFHAFEHPEFDLERVDGELVGDGATWNPVTGWSNDGRTLSRVPAKRVFAFAWQDDHGPDAFY